MEDKNNLLEKRFNSFIKMLAKMSRYTGSYSTVHSESYLKSMLEEDLENHSDFKNILNELLLKYPNPKVAAK